MEFSIFVWSTVAVFFCCAGLMSYLFKNIKFITLIKPYSIYLIGLGILSIVMWFYIPDSMQKWNILNNFLYPYIQDNAYTILLLEVWYTIVFFRNIWPALWIVLIMIVIESSFYPISARYRMMYKFSHSKLLVMVGSLFCYFTVNHFDSSSFFASFFLGIATYTAAFYWRFGFATILYILKKSYIPYEIGLILLIGSPIVAGEYFLLPLVACIGIGISDIWMDYHHRNASSMVFSLDFN